jgi:hypothetical protein
MSARNWDQRLHNDNSAPAVEPESRREQPAHRSTCGCGIFGHKHELHEFQPMMQLVAGSRHFNAANDLPVGQWFAVETHNGQLVVGWRLGSKLAT